MKQFKDWADFKRGAEMFDAGQIVPARIAKFNRKRDKYSSRLTFIHDCYARFVGGDVYLIPDPDQQRVGQSEILYIRDAKNVTVMCAPYFSGSLFMVGWVGNDAVTTVNSMIANKVAPNAFAELGK